MSQISLFEEKQIRRAWNAEKEKWLFAKVGYERLEEIENPELAATRMRETYEQKGYSEEWIEKRLRGIAVRDELTDEWKKRGVKQGKEFAILTVEISKATFGMTPSEYKGFKALSNPKENLRDHMTDLELIFTMLAPLDPERKNGRGSDSWVDLGLALFRDRVNEAQGIYRTARS